MGDIAAQVGLQLLLQPYGNTIGQISCTTVGVIYPAYASFKAVELMVLRDDNSEAIKWLTYWSVYASINVIERLLDKVLPWIPYYHTLKLALLLWLQLPRYCGAYRLSNQFVRPFLRKWHRHIDAVIDAAQQTVMRPELLTVMDALNHVLARVPFLEWFVRGPDGRPVVPPPSSGRGMNFLPPAR